MFSSTPLAADGTHVIGQWAGGVGVLTARGNFSAGTLSLETCDTNSVTDSDWVPVGAGGNLAALTAAGSAGFTVGVNWWIRVRLQGSAPTPSIVYSVDGAYGRAAAGT